MLQPAMIAKSVVFSLTTPLCIAGNQDGAGAGRRISSVQAPRWQELADGRNLHQSSRPLEVPLTGP